MTRIQTIMIICGAIGGLIGAAQTDISAYRRARRNDSRARFDWGLAIPRAIKGTVSGVSVAAGALAATGVQ